MFPVKYKIFVFCIIYLILFSDPVSARYGIGINGPGVGYWILLIVPSVFGLAYLFFKLIKLCCPAWSANHRTKDNAGVLLPCYREEIRGQSPPSVHPPNGHNNCYFVPPGQCYESQWTYTEPQPGFVYPNPTRGQPGYY